MTADYAASDGNETILSLSSEEYDRVILKMSVIRLKVKPLLCNILDNGRDADNCCLWSGASSKLYIPSENRIERVENVKDVGVYLERFDDMINRKKNAVEKEEGRLFNAY